MSTRTSLNAGLVVHHGPARSARRKPSQRSPVSDWRQGFFRSPTSQERFRLQMPQRTEIKPRRLPVIGKSARHGGTGGNLVRERTRPRAIETTSTEFLPTALLGLLRMAPILLQIRFFMPSGLKIGRPFVSIISSGGGSQLSQKFALAFCCKSIEVLDGTGAGSFLLGRGRPAPALRPGLPCRSTFPKSFARGHRASRDSGR